MSANKPLHIIQGQTLNTTEEIVVELYESKLVCRVPGKLLVNQEVIEVPYDDLKNLKCSTDYRHLGSYILEIITSTGKHIMTDIILSPKEINALRYLQEKTGNKFTILPPREGTKKEKIIDMFIAIFMTVMTILFTFFFIKNFILRL